MSIIKSKEKGNLVVISGPSGAGKDTIVNELKKINNNIWLSVSMTTREKRGKEEDGIDYFFVTEEEFKEKINNDELLEYAIYNNNYYGTPKEKIQKYLNKGIDVLLIIEIQGALKVKEKVDDALFIFILPPSMEELRKRLTNRNTETKEKILERFKKAYQEINEVTKYNYVVINDDIIKATEKVNAIILAERCRVDRIEEVYLNNTEELLHEELIEKEIINQKREI